MIIILADYVIAKIHSMMRLCAGFRATDPLGPQLVNNDNEAHFVRIIFNDASRKWNDPVDLLGQMSQSLRNLCCWIKYRSLCSAASVVCIAHHTIISIHQPNIDAIPQLWPKLRYCKKCVHAY